MPRQILCKFRFREGYASALSPTDPSDHMRPGTVNYLITGGGTIVPFKGFTENVAAGVPGRLYFLTDDGYASLGDDGEAGKGSVFQGIDLLFFVGAGTLRVNGQELTEQDGVTLVSASTQLQYLVRQAGQFTNGDDSHRFDVGHGRPSKPTVIAKSNPSPGQKPMNAVVGVAVWRVDSNTGQFSLLSEAVQVTVTNGSVIVQFDLPDNNGQDYWGIGGTRLGVQIGNVYELPADIGEIAESTLSYTRAIAQASSTVGTKVLTLNPATPADKRFTSADIGRRAEIAGKVDSWITDLTDEFTANLNDNASGTAADEALTITHAVDGYTRAVEVSWSDDDLMSTAELAPVDALPPPDGLFGGQQLDVFWVEDLNGTVYYSLPNTLSFSRKRRKIFTEDKAVAYIKSGGGYDWRIAKQSISRLGYVGGDTPLQLDIMTKSAGCLYPQNACLGEGGRLLAWTGRPTLVTPGGMDSTFYLRVEPDFDGWEDQTESEPVVPAFDPVGHYELWCKGEKVMAMHGPTGRWCSPILLSAFGITGTIVGQVIIDGRLNLVVDEGATYKLYKWNQGAGSATTLRTYHRELPANTTATEVAPVLIPGSGTCRMSFKVIKDFTVEKALAADSVPAGAQGHVGQSYRPNVRGSDTMAIEVTCPAATGKAGVDYINVFGEWNEAYSNPEA